MALSVCDFGYLFTIILICLCKVTEENRNSTMFVPTSNNQIYVNIWFLLTAMMWPNMGGDVNIRKDMDAISPAGHISKHHIISIC